MQSVRIELPELMLLVILGVSAKISVLHWPANMSVILCVSIISILLSLVAETTH